MRPVRMRTASFFLKPNPLFFQTAPEVLDANLIRGRQHGDAFLAGHVNQNPAGDNGRDRIRSGFGPALVAQIGRGGVAIKNLLAPPQVIQRVDMRARVSGQGIGVVV